MFGHAATYDAAAQPYFTSEAAMPIASPTAARSSGQAHGAFPSPSSLTQPPNEFAEPNLLADAGHPRRRRGAGLARAWEA